MAFTYYTPFTVQAGQVPGAQSNFTVVISDTDPRFADLIHGGYVASSFGYDIRPYADVSLSTALDFELVYYNPNSGVIEMWVRVPSLSDGYVIYLAYGDPAVNTDGSTRTAWDSSFTRAFHYGNIDTGTIGDDSSQSDVDSTLTSVANVTLGLIGEAGDWDVDGLSKADLGTAALPTTGTFSMWFNPSWAQTDGSNHAIGLAAFNGIGKLFQSLKTSSNDLALGWYNDGTDGRVIVASANYTITQGAWNHLAVTWDAATPATKAYLNGAQIGSTNATNGTWDTSGFNAYAGFDSNNVVSALAQIDEVRLSSVVRSANWLTTEYNNQSDPTAFFAMGAQQPVGPTPPTPSNPPRYWYDPLWPMFARTIDTPGEGVAITAGIDDIYAESSEYLEAVCMGIIVACPSTNNDSIYLVMRSGDVYSKDETGTVVLIVEPGQTRVFPEAEYGSNRYRASDYGIDGETADDVAYVTLIMQ